MAGKFSGAKTHLIPQALNAQRAQLMHPLFPDDLVFLKRTAADMLVFQISYGWRRYKELTNNAQLPSGKYVISSPTSYLSAPYRALLFASETAGNGNKPSICGFAAEILVRAFQTTYKAHPGNGDISDDLLAYFPPGVAKAWSAPGQWTSDTFRCNEFSSLTFEGVPAVTHRSTVRSSSIR